jgi:ATP-binding protein involved in chromosome partitioning
VKYRSYHSVTGEDRSRLADQVGAQQRAVTDRLREVRRVVAVMSGKGGVGKSYVTAALALGAAARLEGAVGVLDADLGGPTVARLLGAAGPLQVADDEVAPAIGLRGIRVFSMDLLLEEGMPLRWRTRLRERHLWRGALEHGVLREFLADVAWGRLELLLVDLAPGADRLEDLAALVPDLAGAVAVTLPSEESERAVERAMCLARELPVPLLGVVENMSGHVCGSCGAVTPLFAGRAGSTLAARFGVPLLAELPFVPPSERASPSPALADALLAVLP